MKSGRSLAVVIPTLDEAERLPGLLEDLARLDADIVVCDGGSNDETRAIAQRMGARVIQARRGRAAQLDAGARATDADWLLFIHADSRVPADTARALVRFLAEAEPVQYAHFRFAFDETGFAYRLLEAGQRVRERVLGLAYGDQGLVVSRSLFEEAGGYPRWPILEDVGMLERLSAVGRKVRLGAPLATSPRRYREEGRLRGWFRNVAIIALYRFGVPVPKIADRFPRSPARDTPTSGRTLVVFAKAPRPGFVKTRLAADVGSDEATRIYRSMGRTLLDALRRGRDRPVVYHAPPEPEAAQEIEAWLGGDIECRPQSGPDLGARMAQAFQECFAHAQQVCIVGTDIPGIDSTTVERAFAGLRDHDVVIGPATDGGYYLIALSAPAPGLFVDVPWSTSDVLAETRARAASLGLTIGLLEPKTDVDELVDVPPGLRSA